MESNSKKIHIGKSALHGRGLIASKDLKKGERIFLIKGKKIEFLIHDTKSAKIAEVNWIGVGKNRWLDPRNFYGACFNHSCNPNSIIAENLWVVALRDIKKGEEITFDYSTCEADIFWEMKCDCRHKNCRKTIKSIQFLDKESFKKYKGYISKYYKMVYNKHARHKFDDENGFKKYWVSFLKK